MEASVREVWQPTPAILASIKQKQDCCELEELPKRCSKPRVMVPCPISPEVKKRSDLRWYYLTISLQTYLGRTQLETSSRISIAWLLMLCYTCGLVGSSKICHCTYTWGFPCPAAIGRDECLFTFEIMSNRWFHLEEAQLSHREIISFQKS